MATKKLSRTVIEGGRYGSNKYQRRYSHAEVRAEERAYIKAVMADLDSAEELEIDECRPVMKEFKDKLRPMYRWLEAQVGRMWSEVRSEIFQKFDTRTTAGRHITFDHLLREIVDTESGFDKFGRIVDPEIPKEPDSKGRRTYWSYADYYVDQNGVLCKRPTNRYTSWRWQSVSPEEYQQAEAWLQNRMIGEINGKLHWFMPTEGVWKASWLEPPSNYYNIHHLYYSILENGLYDRTPSLSPVEEFLGYTGKRHGDYWERVDKPFSFRRRGELTAEEVKTFRSFKKKIQEDILSYTQDR